MAVTDWLARLTRQAPVPVHVARGVGGHAALARLRAHPEVRLVPTPRHATVLVVAGAIPRDHLGALARVHDQVPAPRGIASLGLAGDPGDLGLGREVTVLDPHEPAPGLRRLHEQVMAGRADHPTLGPGDHPVDWQGVGPHGQGGEGMMGGTPYGRMMPMPPTEGRDGLALDRLSLRLGPFLPGLPPGLVLEVGLQGDVLEEVSLHPATLDDPPIGAPTDAPGGPTGEATRLLVALAELCAVAGLGALARRAARVALSPDPADVARLRHLLDRPWALRVATDGVGHLDDGTDVTARWRAWLDRAEATASDSPAAAPPPRRDPAAVAEAMRGAELGRAWLTLASLSPDLEPTAPAPTPAATP